MRTFGKVLEHLMVIGLCGGLCYAGATYIAHQISGSLNQSAMLIDNAGSGR